MTPQTLPRNGHRASGIWTASVASPFPPLPPPYPPVTGRCTAVSKTRSGPASHCRFSSFPDQSSTAPPVRPTARHRPSVRRARARRFAAFRALVRSRARQPKHNLYIRAAVTASLALHPLCFRDFSNRTASSSHTLRWSNDMYSSSSADVSHHAIRL